MNNLIKNKRELPLYTFKKTEINNKKATDFETKSMLYLLGMRKDSEEIEIIAVDCFNDVTGLNKDFSKLWDVQSKNHSTLPPSKIGESLVTLYDNYISLIYFCDYILFIPKLTREYLVNDALNVYGYENISQKQKEGIEKKLKEKINGDKSGNTPLLFLDFLTKVTFVEDNNEISAYIKAISKFKNKSSIPEEVYEKIFKEIRDAQASLKNSYIENKKISHPSEVMKFGRHITKLEINTLLISRLIGIDDIFSFKGVPLSFMYFINDKDMEEAKDLLQECNENLSRAFFDKNGCKEFWKLSEMLIRMVKENLSDSVINVYNQLDSSKIKTTYLTPITIQYMISLIKTGLENVN